MDIGQYISDLLKEHEEVGLSGIGTFYKRAKPSFFNKEDGLFYPPSYEISFKEDGGPSSAVLTNHIVSDKHISEPSALYFIERFCENIKKNLEKNSSTDITPLGKLISTSRGIVFETSWQGASPANFGLRALKEPALITTNTSSTSAEIQDAFVEDEGSSGYKLIWVFLAILLSMAAIAGAAYFYYPQFFKFNNNQPQKSSKKNEKQIVAIDTLRPAEDSISFADSIVNQLEKQGMHGAQVEKAPDSVKISSIPTSPDSLKVKSIPKKTFEVIIASFGLKREAENSVRAFRRRGIDAKVITDKKKPRFKISIGSFPSMRAANIEQNRIRKELFKDAWILELSNKENQ